jgi:Rrf2 family protein
MTSLSLTTGYAIEALTCLARYGDPSMRVGEIAEIAEVPAAYLSKIFQRLSEAGIVESKRGYKGGVRLCKLPEHISLLEIDEAVEAASTCPHAAHAHKVSPRPDTFWYAFHQSYCKKLASMTLAQVLSYEMNPSPVAL